MKPADGLVRPPNYAFMETHGGVPTIFEVENVLQEAILANIEALA
jgi:hypothetical protein